MYFVTEIGKTTKTQMDSGPLRHHMRLSLPCSSLANSCKSYRSGGRDSSCCLRSLKFTSMGYESKNGAFMLAEFTQTALRMASLFIIRSGCTP